MAATWTGPRSTRVERRGPKRGRDGRTGDRRAGAGRARVTLWAVTLLALAGLGGCAAVYAEHRTAAERWDKERASYDNRVLFLLHMNKELRANVATRDARITLISATEADLTRLNADIAAARHELAELAAAHENTRAAVRVDLAEAEAKREKMLASARAALARAAAVKHEVAANERLLARLDTEIASRRSESKRQAEDVAKGERELAALETRILATRADLSVAAAEREFVARQRMSVEAKIAAAKTSLATVNATLQVREERAEGLESLIRKARSELDSALEHLSEARRRIGKQGGPGLAPGGRNPGSKS